MTRSRRVLHRLLDASVQHVHDALHARGQAGVVGDHADRRTRRVQLGEQLHHRLGVLRVQIAGGLVGLKRPR